MIADRPRAHTIESMATAAEPKARGETLKESRELEVKELSAWYGHFRAIREISMAIGSNQVTAVIGPSGCGKSTLVRCLNRMHEVTPGARVTGNVLLDGEDIYGPDSDAVMIRRRVGMVFQRPNPFPTMSIFDNVAAGLRLNGIGGKHDEIVERTLRQAA